MCHNHYSKVQTSLRTRKTSVSGRIPKQKLVGALQTKQAVAAAQRPLPVFSGIMSWVQIKPGIYAEQAHSAGQDALHSIEGLMATWISGGCQRSAIRGII